MVRAKPGDGLWRDTQRRDRQPQIAEQSPEHHRDARDGAEHTGRQHGQPVDRVRVGQFLGAVTFGSSRADEMCKPGERGKQHAGHGRDPPVQSEFAHDEMVITTPALQITNAWRAAALPVGSALSA